MKILISAFAVALALGFIPPAFAEDVTKANNAADCNKAGGMWNAQSNACAEESAKMGEEEGIHQGAHATPETDTQKIDQPERKDPTTGN
jgi:hypothetical protein